MPRKRPPGTVPVAPVYVSQLNVEAVLGIDAGRYLALLRDHSIPAAHVGKLRVGALDDLRAALGELAIATSAQPPTDDEEDDDQPRHVNDVLRVIGRTA